MIGNKDFKNRELMVLKKYLEVKKLQISTLFFEKPIK